mmetsp:Transcript_43442/g.78045  ORF Transcript_43442/g.78045 Transcript_43442/m.78045 type:complete len:90 (+) Transcript_43442:7-276(+)
MMHGISMEYGYKQTPPKPLGDIRTLPGRGGGLAQGVGGFWSFPAAVSPWPDPILCTFTPSIAPHAQFTGGEISSSTGSLPQEKTGPEDA